MLPHIAIHLSRVYGSVILSVFGTVVGSLTQIYTHPYTKFSQNQTIGIGFILMLFFMAMISVIDKIHAGTRLNLFILFGWSSGYMIGPLVDVAHEIAPYSPHVAFYLTFFMFISFSLVATRVNTFDSLAFGSLLASLLNGLVIMSIANFFIKSNKLVVLDVYFGIILFSGYLIYDTYCIIDRAGTKNVWELDYVEDALFIYLDVLNIFIRILIIIVEQQAKKEKKDK